MTKRLVIVHLSASQLGLAVLRAGRVERSAEVRIDRAEWPQAWQDAMPSIEADLHRMTRELGATGASALVITATPGATCAVSACPRSVALPQAETSARLGLANAPGFAQDGAPIDTVVLSEDAPGVDAPQRHLLAVGDAEPNLRLIEGAAYRAGLVVEAVVPHDAVATLDAVNTVCGDPSGLGAVALWIGEHSSVLVIGIGGRLLLVRPVPLGIASLVEAITRPLRTFGDDSATVTLTRAQARDLIAAVGVPSPDQAISGFDAMRGASLLPHLQPVLQRLSVEIKQSLRFAMGGAPREAIGFRVMGPGGALPGLAAALARVAGIETVVDDKARNNDESPQDADAMSEATLLPIAARLWGRLPRLMTRESRSRITMRLVRAGVLAGTALALTILGGEWFSVRSQIASSKLRLAALTAAANGGEEAGKAKLQALTARVSVAALEARVRRAVGEGPDAAAVMVATARATPEAMTITGLDLSTDTAPHRLNIRAQVALGAGVDASSVVRLFIENLERSPVIASVKLGSTQRTGAQGASGGETQSFEVTAELVNLPASERIADAEGRW